MPRSLLPSATAATLALSLLLSSAPEARAQDASALGAVTVVPTMHALGVSAATTGDADGDASAWVEWRTAGAPAFIPGHPLVRLASGRWAGSVLWLSPDTDYEVRVVIDDPDNGAPLTAAGAGRTRANDPPAAGGGIDLYVDAAGGSDANPGTAAAPLATIQAAADLAGPGDTVHVLPGVYHEQVVPPVGGAAGAPLRFVAEGPGAILDGADPDIAAGLAAWTDEGDGVWSTPFAGETLYLAVDDERIYDYQSLADLLAENGNIAMPGVFPGGFYLDGAAGLLYLRLPDRSDPAGHAVHVAALPSGFLLDTLTDVVVDGFEIRYYGSVLYSGVGVDVRDSARCWVLNNVIHHMNGGVRVRRPLAAENVVELNVFRDTSVYGWPWSSVKAHTPEATAVSVTGGGANIVRWNVLEGSFNGIYTGEFGDGSETIAPDTDVYENVLRFHGDDGLELEGAQVNVRMWKNVVRDVFNGISLAPIEAGPVFVVRNLVWGYKEHVFKINNGTYGFVFVYHTTGVPLDGALFPDAQALSPSVPFGAIVTRNNIWEANRYVIEYGETTLLGPVDWDWDALHTIDVAGAGRFVKWLNVTYPDLPALVSSGTIEANGFDDVPAYEAAASGNFDLVAGHALLDVGLVVPGVNDAFVVGAGPDVGAFERGGVRPGPDQPLPGTDGGVGPTDAGVPPGGDGGPGGGGDAAGGPDAGGGGGRGGCRCAIRSPAPGALPAGALSVTAALFLALVLLRFRRSPLGKRPGRAHPPAERTP